MNGTNMRKWGVRTITGLAGILVMWATTGSWDTEETVALITWGAAASSSFLVPPDENK